jgi:hypothetical protein
MPSIRLTAAATTILLAGSAHLAHAQDSVADTPGTGGDALSAYASQRARYVVDLVEIQSVFGTPFFVGPILKATRDDDPLFNTNALGATAVSPDHLRNVDLGNTFNYVRWTTRGGGIAPENVGGFNVPVSGYDVQFGIVSSDLDAEATNVAGAMVGVNDSNLGRLFVERWMAAQSRIAFPLQDAGTVSAGSVDASGQVHLRADGFNGAGSTKILGENILRVDLGMRNASLLNAVFQSAGSNTTQDTGSTTFLVNNGGVTTNTPAALPATLAGSGLTLTQDFANLYAVEGGPGTGGHLDPAIEAHRGNPTFAAVDAMGGVGVVGSLARSLAGGGLVDSLNLAAVNADGSVAATDAATLPSPMPGFPTLNAAGDAEFTQYLSQTSFRGPNGLAAVGRSGPGGDLMAAATATDPTAGQFIAVARFGGGAPTWTVAAREGQSVLDGPGGSIIGQLVAGAPIGISAPGLDLLGNVYFVARYDPTLGAPRLALFKGVYDGSAYVLELILQEGDSYLGANSASQYTVEALALGDSDSLASAGFHAAQVLQPMVPGLETTDPASSLAFGGMLVNARITYNNLGQAETYEASLFVGPFAVPAPECVGDVNGDGKTDVFDFADLASNFGAGPGATRQQGDLNGDGFVDVFDFGDLAGDFGCSN